MPCESSCYHISLQPRPEISSHNSCRCGCSSRSNISSHAAVTHNGAVTNSTQCSQHSIRLESGSATWEWILRHHKPVHEPFDTGAYYHNIAEDGVKIMLICRKKTPCKQCFNTASAEPWCDMVEIDSHWNTIRHSVLPCGWEFQTASIGSHVNHPDNLQYSATAILLCFWILYHLLTLTGTPKSGKYKILF